MSEVVNEMKGWVKSELEFHLKAGFEAVEAGCMICADYHYLSTELCYKKLKELESKHG